jgi:pyruvate formate lyase activating enzyme
MIAPLAQSDHPARWWTMLSNGRIECRLCPRFCRLQDGQRWS